MFGRKRLFQLDQRLQLCASMVREGCKMADVGTDHAYLPIWLVKQAKVEKAIASDVNLGPLQKAAMHVKRYLVQGQVDTRLSDGLELIFPHEVDDVVIAGMGGELIAGILAKAPWLKSNEKRLILQPMSSAEELRCFLAKEGYAVREEKAVIADGRVYSVMRAEYLPQQVPKHPLYPYIGLLDGSTEESRAYIQRERNHLNKKAEGLQAAGRVSEAKPIIALIQELDDLLAKPPCEKTEGESV